MSWEDQGYQYHGWFGNGTSPNGPSSGDGSAPDPKVLNQRLNAVIGGSVAAMPRAARRFAEAWLDPATRARLTALMTTWSQGGNMDRADSQGNSSAGLAMTVLRWGCVTPR